MAKAMWGMDGRDILGSILLVPTGVRVEKGYDGVPVGGGGRG